MLKTERMKKVVVAGAKPQLRQVIETLHSLKALHIEEHRAMEFFGIGSPLPEGEKIAEGLLKARGLEKSLGLEDETATYALESVEAALDRLAEVEAAVTDLIKERAERVDEGKRMQADIARLRRLAALGLRLEQLHGYQTLKVYVGSVRDDPAALLEARLTRYELAKGRDATGLVIALFVPVDEAASAETVLAEAGYQSIEVPLGEGPVDTVVGQRTTQARQAAVRIDTIDAELVRYKAENGPALLAATETLQTAAEKAGVPSRFATSPNAFVITGFVPVRDQARAERALLAATDQRLYIEWSEPRIGGHHGGHVGERHQEHTGAETVSHASTDEGDNPPVKFAHKNQAVNSFTMLLSMHSLPKYKEIDPTILMYLTFPFFFGVMIGDVGFGILTATVGLFLRNNYVLGIGGPKVSRMLVLSGIWTFIFGAFVYGEMFGIYFVYKPGGLSWEWILGADWSRFYTYTDGRPYLSLGPLQFGVLSKLANVTILLAITIVIALIHLNLAILIGIRNMWVLHGAKHAILGRLSWLILQAGIGIAVYGIMTDASMISNIGWGVFGLSVVMLIAGEGPIAILELPKIFSNALSYTRLAAVALSKAGMTLATNVFAFTMVTDTSASFAGIGGVLLFIVGHIVILALGILAGGLHSLRLQLVEFFGWFYEGGGQRFKAFGDPNMR